MQKLHVVMNQQDLDQQRLHGKVAVVLDVVLATTTIAMALHHGAREVITVPEVEQARTYGGADTILAGEKDAIVPDGFETFAPVALSKTGLKDNRLVLVSTNGTVALHNAGNAAHVYTAALVNATAVTNHLLATHNDETILLVCSGARHRFSLEDCLGAGILVNQLMEKSVDRFLLTDAAIAARTLADTLHPLETMQSARVGHLMGRLDLMDNIDLAATLDCYTVVPKQVDGRIIAA